MNEHVKCRNPRCSFECYRNWSNKYGSVVCHSLDQLPCEFIRYRGNMSLVAGSSSESIQKTIKSFLYELRKWKKRQANQDVEFQIRAVAHCTSSQAMHYDFVAYSSSNISIARLREAVTAMWKTSGGVTVTFKPQEEEHEVGQALYIHKAIKPNRFRRKRIFLLNHNELHLTWQTRGFFRGVTINELWRQVRIEWFGEESVLAFEEKIKRKRHQENERQNEINKLSEDVTYEQPDSASDGDQETTTRSIPWLEVSDRVRAANTIITTTIKRPFYAHVFYIKLLPIPPPLKNRVGRFGAFLPRKQAKHSLLSKWCSCFS
ncbi:hypothetical protein N9D38_10080 [Rubripirellula sp.]|nr:hypothetical protein [Rubripirellula sp.]